eukprot:3145401-Rhodomonas_salina.1
MHRTPQAPAHTTGCCCAQRHASHTPLMRRTEKKASANNCAPGPRRTEIVVPGMRFRGEGGEVTTTTAPHSPS